MKLKLIIDAVDVSRATTETEIEVLGKETLGWLLVTSANACNVDTNVQGFFRSFRMAVNLCTASDAKLSYENSSL